MDASPYLRLFGRWWWTLAIATVVAVAAGYAVASRLPPVYETQVRLLVGPLSANLDTQRAAGQLAQTYAEIATSKPVLESVVEAVGRPTMIAQLAANTQVRADSTTRILTLTVRAASPDGAVELADTLAARLVELGDVGTVEPPAIEANVSIIDPASVPDEPVAPQIALIVVLAGATGLIGSAATVLVIEYLTDVIRDTHDLSPVPPLLGTVASFRSSSPNDLRQRVSNIGRDPAVSDPLRHVAGKLAVRNGGVLPRTVLVVGTRSGDGAGALTTALAAAVTEGGRRVGVIDANGHEREITELAETSVGLGVVDALLADGNRTVELLIQRPPGIMLLPYGAVEPLIELSDTERPKRVLNHLSNETGIVLVNAPAPEQSASALAWARAVEAVVVVVHANFVTRRRVTATLEDLERVGAKTIGVILCSGRPRRAWRRRRADQDAETEIRPGSRDVRTILDRVDPLGSRKRERRRRASG